jgi:hypothetical protein
MGAKKPKAPTETGAAGSWKLSAPVSMIMLAAVLGMLAANHLPDKNTGPPVLEGTNASGLSFQVFHTGGGTKHDALVLRAVIEAQQGEVGLIRVLQSSDGAFDLENERSGVRGRDALQSTAGVNIFVEALSPHWVVAISTLAPQAQNWLLLNHEMSTSFLPLYMLFLDQVLVKTRHAEEIYQKYALDMKRQQKQVAPVVYVGFSSNAPIDAGKPTSKSTCACASHPGTIH